MPKTVDVTPSWESSVPILRVIIEEGNQENREVMWEEITKMARLADKWVQHLKEDVK